MSIHHLSLTCFSMECAHKAFYSIIDSVLGFKFRFVLSKALAFRFLCGGFDVRQSQRLGTFLVTVRTDCLLLRFIYRTHAMEISYVRHNVETQSKPNRKRITFKSYLLFTGQLLFFYRSQESTV